MWFLGIEKAEVAGDRMTSQSAAAIILARGGSKGIPAKNLKTIGGVSLVGRSVLAAINARQVSSVWVSTDDKDIAKEAEKYGARVIDRPDELADDNATSEDGWLHALQVLRGEGTTPDRLVFLQCTSPFTTGADIDACLDAMSKIGARSGISAIEDHSFMWSHNEADHGFGTNHDETSQRLRRQDMGSSYRESGAIYVVQSDAFEQTGNRFIAPVALSPVDHPLLEIDTLADLELAELIARRREGAVQADLSNMLAGIRALVMDFDGVHTDDLVHTTETGAEVVVTSRSDGMGLGRLRESGQCEMLILSKERNSVVQARAEKLKIEALNAIDDKVAALEDWLRQRDLTWEETLFIGNDINDLGALKRAAVSACPSDAHDDVIAVVDWVLPEPGGKGALRVLCDAILAANEPAS